MPETLDRVLEILRIVEQTGVSNATLLVVPGKAWTKAQIRSLGGLAQRGYRLAGHGWIHKAVHEPRSLYHRGHSLLISRDEAEHLSRSPQELIGLILRCHRWFSSVGLPEPELYVPPAWAMGSLKLADLAPLPFRWYEILRGLVHGPSGRVVLLPLAGFEADTTFRRVTLRVWNGLNTLIAERSRMPLRISIHPRDLTLLLRADLKRLVSRPWTFTTEEEIMAGRPAGTP